MGRVALMALLQQILNAARCAVIWKPLPKPMAVSTSVAQPTSPLPSPPRRLALMALLQQKATAARSAEMLLPQLLKQPALIMMQYPLRVSLCLPLPNGLLILTVSLLPQPAICPHLPVKPFLEMKGTLMLVVPSHSPGISPLKQLTILEVSAATPRLSK